MIARELNEQGITTIKGNPWTTSSVMAVSYTHLDVYKRQE